jgi:hypothetical protein
VTRAEEALRATTRAIASTVGDVPPLRLETAPDELGFSGLSPARPLWRGRLRTLIVPAAAAAAVAALAIALVLVRSIPNGGVASPSPTATSTTQAAGGVPEYYVAWIKADRPYLVVGNTRNGGSEGIIPSPTGVYLNGVYGAAADDRTFIVTGTRVPAPGTTVWYLLRLRQGDQAMMTMTLPIPVPQDPAGVALSPDGTQVAVAVNGSPATLRVYSVTTGALVHAWSAPGKFAAAFNRNLPADHAALALRWSPDGSHLGFTWNATAIRSLDVTAPDGSLLSRSTALLAIGPTYSGIGSVFICDAWQGWSLLDGGSGVLCAGSLDNSGVSRAAGDKPLKGSVGFVLERHFTGGEETSMALAVPLKTSKAGTGDAAYLGWANGDGSVVIGSTVADGKTRSGILRKGRFSAWPTLPGVTVGVGARAVVPVGVRYGADAW